MRVVTRGRQARDFKLIGRWLPRVALAVAVAVSLAPAVVAGQDKPSGKAARGDKEQDAPKVKVERGAHGRKVYRITTGFVIEGRIQKPNAFYVLQRSQINYDWAQLKKNFLPRILQATRKSPF